MGNTSRAVRAWEALYRAQVEVLKDVGAQFPDEGVSYNEYDVMLNLSRYPDGVRIKELNQVLLLRQPSVSRLLDRLAARGLVVKSHDPGDGRGRTVALTDDGTRIFRVVGSHHARELSKRVGDVLTNDELAQLEALCTKLRHAI